MTRWCVTGIAALRHVWVVGAARLREALRRRDSWGRRPRSYESLVECALGGLMMLCVIGEAFVQAGELPLWAVAVILGGVLGGVGAVLGLRWWADLS